VAEGLCHNTSISLSSASVSVGDFLGGKFLLLNNIQMAAFYASSLYRRRNYRNGN
jgi:hypothetical protein